MTRQEICKRLDQIREDMGWQSLKDKGWDQYVHACNVLSCRVSYYPSWSKQKLEEVLEIAEIAGYVWEHIEDPRASSFVDIATHRGYHYDQDIRDAYEALHQ